MRFQTLAEWLSWQEQLHSAAIDLGLERVRRVAASMGLLEPEAKVITVAGTNGKGSCVATLQALCLASGISVGAFTSPHFLRYNERIRINGEEVSDALLCEAFANIDAARGETSLTYFEFGTLAALWIMQQAKVDVMVLEVGLGGRLDAVNILDCDVGIVTSIALDHQDWLGSDLGIIGFEKAGIFRPHRWAISADEGAPASVADYAHDIGANWVGMGLSTSVRWSEDGKRWDFCGVTPQGQALCVPDLPVPVLPMPSVMAAMQAFALLGLPWPATISEVLEQLSLTGRCQRVSWKERELMLDVAHNPAAAELMSKRLEAQGGRAVHCVVGIMADKDRAAIFAPLLNRVAHWHVASIPSVARAASAAQLSQNLSELGVSGEQVSAFDAVSEALAHAVACTQPGDQILVMGSFYTVASVLALLQEHSTL